MAVVSPVPGYVSSRYGRRGSGNHLGLDIATNKKPGPVYAMFDGVFERIVRGRGRGNTSRKNELAAFRTGDGPIIRNPDGERQLYGHVDVDDRWKVGDRIKAGDYIGMTNLSGNTSGYHCHLEIWNANGTTRNPEIDFRYFGITPGAKPKRANSNPWPKPTGLTIPGVTASSYPNRATADSAAALDRAWATFLFAYGYRTRYLKDRMRRWLSRWEALSDYTGAFGTAKAHDEAQVKGLQRLLRATGQYKGAVDGDRGPMTRAAEAAYLNGYADNVRQIIRNGK